MIKKLSILILSIHCLFASNTELANLLEINSPTNNAKNAVLRNDCRIISINASTTIFPSLDRAKANIYIKMFGNTIMPISHSFKGGLKKYNLYLKALNYAKEYNRVINESIQNNYCKKVDIISTDEYYTFPITNIN